MKKIYISVVAPVRNEEGNLLELHSRLQKSLDSIKKPYEIIYVENGSTDDTLKILKTLNKAKVISLRVPLYLKKSMQSSAIDAGIKFSEGELIVTIDSDLQNPPEEIPDMVKMLENDGYDVVSGWRKDRHDSFIIRNLSLIGSYIRKWFINPGVHDLGCTLKVYRKECFEHLNLYGELHRYTVAILKWRGFFIGEKVVKHYERKSGKSKYKWSKMLRGFIDMWMIWFSKKYYDRPLHLFGVGGFLIALTGLILLITLGILRVLSVISLENSIWPLVAVLMIILGVQLFVFGIVIDIMMRNYYSLSEEKSYFIKEKFIVTK